MFTPSYQEHFKTKEQAVSTMLSLLVENPAVAGLDGYLNITAFGNYYRLRPVKKVKKEE